MLLRLFQMMNTMPTCSSDAKRGSVFVRSSCDRHLLEAAHKRINVGAVVAVLKAILMLGMIGCASLNVLTVFTLICNLSEEEEKKQKNVTNHVAFLCYACCIGDSSNADVKERTSPSKKDSTMDNIMTKLFSGLDDDSDLGIRNVSG